MDPLYILPFDHRHSYIEGLFHWKEPLTAQQAADVTMSKEVIYEGFVIAAATMPDRAGILVDEEFGAGILRDASARGFITCVPTEKSGQDEFDFAYGGEFARHIEAVNPTFAKGLVRYDADGDTALNARQLARLRRLAEYLAATRRRFMFELLVPPDPASQARLMIDAIRQCQDAGVQPDVWKIEGLDQPSDAERVVQAAKRGGRAAVGCIVLGRGSDEQAVARWLKIAAGIPGFIGFAIGRTTWWDAIAALRSNTISRHDAAARIAARFREWADIFESGPQASQL